MSAAELRKSSGWLLALGVVGLLLALGLLVGKGLTTQAEIIENFYAIDRATGMLEGGSAGRQSQVILRSYGPFLDIFAPATGAAVLALVFVLLGVWRSDRVRRRGLLRIVLPLLATLLIGLIAGLFPIHRAFDQLLFDIHRLVSDKPVASGSDGLCTVYLEPCSRLVAGETIRALAFAGLALVVLALIPAGRAAWRVGERGHRLGMGWSGAAWFCFVCGALALVATRAHRVDLERTLVLCEQDHLLMPWNNRWTHLLNVSPTELQVQRVEACEPADWKDFIEVFGERAQVVGEYQLSADGRLSALPMADAWFVTDWWGMERPPSTITDAVLGERLEEKIDATVVGGEPAVMLLYFDERSSIARLEGVLTAAQRAGVVGVILVGEALIDDELATVGAWQQRVYCPFGRLQFSTQGNRLEDFESAAELADRASTGMLATLTLAL